MNGAAGITDKPTVGIRDDAFEPPGMDPRRVGARLPRCSPTWRGYQHTTGI